MNLTENFASRGTIRDQDRSVVVQRWGAMLGGSALAIYGLTRRTPFGFALAATGGAVAFLGSRSDALRKEVQAYSSVIVNVSQQEAYRFWRDFQNLPRFMNHLENVSDLGNGRSRWTALGPMGKQVSWTAEIEDERENEFISWRSAADSPIQTQGFVSFRPAIGKPGTLIETSTEFHAPSSLGLAAAKLVGKDPSFLIRQDLRRLKALMETGEIPTTDGQAHGPRSSTTAFARMMDPNRPIRSDAGFRNVFEAQRRIS